MATNAYESVVHEAEGTKNVWIGAGIAGIVGGLVMGLMLHFMMGAMPMIGSLYGQPTLWAGWIAHMVHSVAFALIFVLAITRAPLSGYADTPAKVTGVGAIYGIVLWLTAAAIVMPLWLGMPEMVPNLNAMSLVGHVVYGVVLGAVFAFVR